TMQWTDIKIITDKKNEDICNIISAEVCPLGVQIEDYSDLETQVQEIAHVDLIEQDLIDKDRSKIIIHHYISPELDAQNALLTLENRLGQLGVTFTCAVEYVNQEDWESGWKAYYHPMDVGEKLAICPSWEDYKTHRKILKLDPGMAFGTGTHETTFLCLEVLDRVIKGGERVLDVGTGSGILGIASVLLGAEEVDGVDIDPMAVKVAGENSKFNAVEDKFNIKVGDLSETATGKYDIIVANIVANAVIALSKDVPALLKSDGLYITSGIIAPRKDEVLWALTSYGFKIKQLHEKNNWVCIEATL
ncbi:MAG: 50S ribosomal protein L11 methyltransferase, partial [Oscillospiraceae bacterium]